MINNPDKLTNNSVSSSANAIPDPWEEKLPTKPGRAHPSWQFPLNPNHEIASASAQDTILPLQGDPTTLRISAHASRPVKTSIEVLLQDELKIKAAHAKTLWGIFEIF